MYSHWYNHTQSPMIITNVEVSRDSKILEPFELSLDDETFETEKGNKCIVVIESRSASTVPSELRRLFLNRLATSIEGGDDTDSTDVTTDITTEVVGEVVGEVVDEIVADPLNIISAVISMGAAETRAPEDYSKYLFSPIEKE